LGFHSSTSAPPELSEDDPKGVEDDYRSKPAPKSATPILQEKPWHRTAAYQAALGADDTQIAKALGKCRQTVWKLRQQPWFQARVEKILHEQGGQLAHQLLGVATPLAVSKLAESMNSPNEKVAVRAAADVLRCAIASKLIVEAPPQKTPESPAEIAADIERLQAECAWIKSGRRLPLPANDKPKPDGS
jgi:hypothetical protein